MEKDLPQVGDPSPKSSGKADMEKDLPEKSAPSPKSKGVVIRTLDRWLAGMDKSAAESDLCSPEAKNIDGWLLIFVAASALNILYVLVSEIFAFQDLKAQIPEHFPQLYLALLAEIVLLGFYSYALYAICAHKEKAVPLNKLLLICSPFIRFVTLAVMGVIIMKHYSGAYMFIFILMEDPATRMNLIVWAAISAFYSTIWYLYFCNSRRVKNIFAKRDLLDLFSNSRDKLEGVGGWLLVFVIINALGILYVLVRDISGFQELKGQLPELFPQLYLVLLVEIVFLGFYGYALYGICARKPKAVPLIKAALICNALITFVVFALMGAILKQYLGEALDFFQFMRESVSGASWHIAGSFTQFAVWYLYFTNSKRVKNTFAKRNLRDLFV